jgi:hypothetical protein
MFCPPDGCAIGQGKHGLGVIATRNFKAGDLLFENQTELFKPSEYDVMLIGFPDPDFPHPTYPSAVYHHRSVAKLANVPEHTLKRGEDLQEFIGFHTFGNHSCAPNCVIIPDPSDATRHVTHSDLQPRALKYTTVSTA